MASPHPDLTRLLELQAELEARVRAVDGSARAVLDVGADVLRFAESEESAFFPILPLLDPAARAELGGEHDQLREDLELLDWLFSTTPDSPDVSTLAEAIARRMCDHIARDGRLLLQAARISARSDASGIR
jgi:hypothetical protein